MNLVQRNIVIGVITSFGVLGATSANALDWSEAPQVIGTIVGGGIGGALGSASTNPFIAGASGAAGGYFGGKVGPYVAEHPKQSVEIYSVASTGPIGVITFGVREGVSATENYVKNLFW